MGNQQTKLQKQSGIDSYKITEVQFSKIAPKSGIIQGASNFQRKSSNEQKIYDDEIQTKENNMLTQKLLSRESQKDGLSYLKSRGSAKTQPLRSCLNVSQQGNHTFKQLQQTQYDNPQKSLKNVSLKLLEQSKQKLNCGSQKQNNFQIQKSKKSVQLKQTIIEPKSSHINIRGPLNYKSQIPYVAAFPLMIKF